MIFNRHKKTQTRKCESVFLDIGNELIRNRLRPIADASAAGTRPIFCIARQ